MKTIRYQMYYSVKLLNTIDEIKEEKGFTYRSQAIIYLINLGIDSLKREKK